MRTIRQFTAEEDELIASRVYDQFGAAYLAKKFNRQTSSIMGRRKLLTTKPQRICRRPNCNGVVPIARRSSYCSEDCIQIAKDVSGAIWRQTPQGKASRARYHLQRMQDQANREAKRQRDRERRKRAILLCKVRRFARLEGITVDEAYQRFGVRRFIAKKYSAPDFYVGGRCRNQSCRKHARHIDGRNHYCSDDCRSDGLRSNWRESKRRERAQAAAAEAHP